MMKKTTSRIAKHNSRLSFEESGIRCKEAGTWNKHLGADDRARTGDLDLGKVALYQLSYVRVDTYNSPTPPSAKPPGLVLPPYSG